MKILYAIQGTGNGHISRAREVVSILQKMGDVDLLISGIQADVDLPWVVKYRFYGLSFIFGKNGGVDIWKTYKKSKLKKLYKEIKSLPVNEYDLIINDFEPVSAWACYFAGKECISLSHQAAVINAKSPKPSKFDPVGKTVLKHYAPVSKMFGFHFKKYDEDIYTPVIRSEVRNLKVENKGHYTVYLPAYNDERIFKILSKCEDVKWEVFSKHNTQMVENGNVLIKPITNKDFLQSLASCKGVLCGAGFETPAEALFLEKKLMVIPMKGQFEQQCNAEALKKMGVPIIKSLKKKNLISIKSWLLNEEKVEVNYPDETEMILQKLLASHVENTQLHKPREIKSLSDFKKLNLKKIFRNLQEI